MSVLDALEIVFAPGAIGCAVGIAIAGLLHLAFPSQDLIFVQALIVASGIIIGLYYSR